MSSKKSKHQKPAPQAIKSQPAAQSTAPIKSNSFFNQFTLLIISFLVVFTFWQLYKNWFEGVVMTYWDDFQEQRFDMSLETRKTMRYGNSYAISKQVADYVAQKKLTKDTPVVLIPTTDYFRKHGIEYPVPEPVVFYYYTNLRTVSPGCKDAMKANWVMFIQNNQPQIIPVQSKDSLANLVAEFKKYEQ
jgi:hypothetical protein